MAVKEPEQEGVPVGTYTVRENRRSNLRYIYRGYASQKELAKAIGMNTPQVSQILRGERGMGDVAARRAERMLGYSRGWMDYPHDGVSGVANEDVSGNLTPHQGFGRRVPMLDDEQAKDPKSTIDRGSAMEEVVVDPDTAEIAGPYLFAYRVKGEAMEDDYHERDIIMVDVDSEPRPGEDVVAVVNDRVLLRRYAPQTPDGSHFELHPANPYWPKIEGHVDNGDTVVGPVVEFRRRMR